LLAHWTALTNCIYEKVGAILGELNALGTHEDRQRYFDNELWGLILMSYFKASKGLTDKEIRLYLLRQEKGGKRCRSLEAVEKREKKNKVQIDLLYECFMDWQHKHVEATSDDKTVEEYDDDDDDDDVSGVSSKKKISSIAALLVKEKKWDKQIASALIEYEKKLLWKAGAL
jgi:predicted glutamine amidotransferase